MLRVNGARLGRPQAVLPPEVHSDFVGGDALQPGAERDPRQRNNPRRRKAAKNTFDVNSSATE